MATFGSSIITASNLFFGIFQGLFYLACYVLFSYGLYTIANRKGESNTWLAFIPIANFYLLGKIVGNFKILNKEMKNVEIILPLAFILFYSISGFWILSSLISAVSMLFIAYALYTYYDQVVPERAMFYAIISAILPTIGIPIIFYMIKDK